MAKPKKPEPNPIEEAIGDRVKPKTEAEKILQTPAKVAEEILSSTLDEPSPSEMLILEELNRQTEERLQDPDEIRFPQEPTVKIVTPKSLTLVSKPDPQSVTENSIPESPPQKIDLSDVPSSELKEAGGPIREYTQEEAEDAQKVIDESSQIAFKITENVKDTPAEDIELTALRKYIQEDGFVLATVAFHIVTLCAQPMVVPSTTTWDFKDRAWVPDMVFTFLNQPGYLESIWPMLAIVMGSNKGNSAWCAGIATTIAFFDCIRTLPALKELQNAD